MGLLLGFCKSEYTVVGDFCGRGSMGSASRVRMMRLDTKFGSKETFHEFFRYCVLSENEAHGLLA